MSDKAKRRVNFTPGFAISPLITGLQKATVAKYKHSFKMSI